MSGLKLRSNNQAIINMQVITLSCDEELVRLVFADGKEIMVMPYEVKSLVIAGPRKDEGAEDPDDLDDVLDDDKTEFDDITDDSSTDDDDDLASDDDDEFEDDWQDDDDSFVPDPDKDI